MKIERIIEHINGKDEERKITKLINRVSRHGHIKVTDWCDKEYKMILWIEIDGDAVNSYHRNLGEFDITDQF